MYVWDEWFFPLVGMGITFDLGKGWTGRIEQHGSGSGFRRHVVLIDKHGNEHAQNDDGSPHDSGGNPPNSVKKSLKNKKGWDWDLKEKDWLNKIDIKSGIDGDGWIVTYPNNRVVTILNPIIMGVPMIAPYPDRDALVEYYSGSYIINQGNETGGNHSSSSDAKCTNHSSGTYAYTSPCFLGKLEYKNEKTKKADLY